MVAEKVQLYFTGRGNCYKTMSRVDSSTLFLSKIFVEICSCVVILELIEHTAPPYKALLDVNATVELF